jgi:hypothetical protein
LLNRCIAVIVPILLLFACMGDPARASGKKRDRSAILEVPTAGKILDVVYQPEFDEWWVKCREGETICVYSYDPRAREWGKIVFVPKKPDDNLKLGEKTRPTGETDKTKEGAQPEKTEEAKQEPAKEPAKRDRKTDAKWWDPFKILKQGEKLIHLPGTENKK